VDRNDEAVHSAAKQRRSSVGRLTKEQEQARFIKEFLRRLNAATNGERVYMPVGDLFKDADVIRLDERRDEKGTKRDE
jgi:hypothetical protein